MLLLITGSALLLTIVAFVGKNNIYREQPYHYSKMPALALIFQGVNEDRYPWMIFFAPPVEETLPVSALAADEEAYLASLPAEPEYDQDLTEEKNIPVNQASDTSLAYSMLRSDPAFEEKAGAEINGGTEAGINSEADDGTEANDSEPMTGLDSVTETAEIKPLRSTTKEEAQNHISVDIYGTAGVERAGAYEFATVDENYFNDALFIGDSRTVGLRDYSSISEHGDFMCATALTVHKIFDGDIGDSGNMEDLLQNKDYAKIYLSVGINELGRGTTEDFTESYRAVVNKLREAEPDAIIILQAVMKVSKEKSDGDPIYNNSNIEARNRAIATLADNQHVFYIDVNEVMCDEEGNLHADYSHDGVHLLGSYIEEYKQFLLAHGTVAAPDVSVSEVTISISSPETSNFTTSEK